MHFPRVLGHEIVGEIVAIGAGVDRHRPGDHIAVEPVINCGTCYSCKIGYPHSCCDLKFRGIHCDGGMQEYLSVPERKVYSIPQQVPFTQAVLAEPLGIGFEAVRLAKLLPGDTVAIPGAGAIGLACLVAVKENGYVALVSDRLDDCLERAQRLGADRPVNITKEELGQAVMKFTDGVGANVIFECAGVAGNFSTMIESASTCGRIVLVGLIFDEVKYIPRNQVAKSLHIIGTRNSSLIPQAIAFLESRGAAIERVLVTHTVPFQKAVEGFQLAGDPDTDSCKVIITF
jgi:L-gulonate 5-dehydrogenase